MSQLTPSPVPPFDPAKPHLQKPRLRPVRGFPAEAQGPDGATHVMLGLADARQVSDKIVLTLPASQLILPLMDGSRGLDEMVKQVGRGLDRKFLEGLVSQLDDAGLLEGPTFDALLSKLRQEFDASDLLPPASTAAFAEALVERNEDGTPKEQLPISEELQAERLKKLLDAWMNEVMKQAPDGALNALPRAIVTPHLDYPRGWINYAAVFGRLRVADRPDRVIILGTNHFGLSTGVCGCDKGYRTVLGACEADKVLIEKLNAKLGEENSRKLFANRYDHEREHSIELQIPWIQHVFGKDEAGNYPRVFGALVHDPAVKNGESYDGNGLDLQPFVDALKAAIAEMPGGPSKTLIISSADLSHAGPAFGDQHALAGDEGEGAEARNRIFQHDQEMLQLLAENKPWDLVSQMAWMQNPTRWCSTGNLVAGMLIAEPKEIKVLNYSAAMDQQGTAMVSSVAMIMN